MLRIGILSPRSTLYPTMAFDLINGLKCGLEYANLLHDVTIFTDNIGFGIDEAEIYTKAEKMILNDNADIVIACCDSRIAAMLQPLFTAAGKLLLITNMGANLPEGWQPQPTTIVHSLNFCFYASLTGVLAAAHETAAMAASYYDGGYNQVYTMVSRFQQNGGRILFNHVTHLESQKFTLEPLRQFMSAENGTHNLLCLFSADMAALFYKAIEVIQQNQPCNLFVAPMMLEASLRAELKNEVTVANVQGYTPWLPELENTNNINFIQAYQQTKGQLPNIFSLLGWDSALIIEQLNIQLTVNNYNTAKAVAAIANGNAINSPRGWIKLDPATYHTYGPAYLVKANNNFILDIEEQHQTEIDVIWQSFTREMGFSATDLYSGWRNTYLCI